MKPWMTPSVGWMMALLLLSGPVARSADPDELPIAELPAVAAAGVRVSPTSRATALGGALGGGGGAADAVVPVVDSGGGSFRTTTTTSLWKGAALR